MMMLGHENSSVGQQLKAVYQNGVFMPLSPVDLDDQQRVNLSVEIASTQPEPSQSARPIWEIAEELAKQIPDTELDQLPRDGAAEHDHYLYGSPKRSQ